MNRFKKFLGIVLSLVLVFSSTPILSKVVAVSPQLLSDNVRELPTDMGENLVSNQLPLYTDYYEKGNAYSERVVNHDNFNLTNGVVNDSWHSSGAVFADYNGGNVEYYRDGTTFFTFTFRLKKVTDLSGLCVLHHPTRDMTSDNYELYASSDYRTLFWEENKIVTVDNSSADCRQILKCDIDSVSFVGMKFITVTQSGFTNPSLTVTKTTNNHYPRLSEFCVYGTEGEETEYPVSENLSYKTVISEEPANADILDINESFLLGVKESVTYRKGNNTVHTGNGNSDRLTDGDLSKDWYFSGLKFTVEEDGEIVFHRDESNYYVDITFDAGKTQSLGLLYINHIKSVPLRMMHYKVYASNNADSKTNDASLIADCYNHNGAREHYISVSKDISIKARYYTIRVYDPCYDYSSSIVSGSNATVNPYTRINEIAAYSTDYLEANLEFDGFDTQGEDLGYVKSGATVSSVVNGYKGKGNVQVLDKNGIPKGLSKSLTFGDRVVTATGYGNEKQAEFVFCGDVNSSGSYTVSDVVQVLRQALTGEPLFETRMGDTNSDGEITVTDVTALLQTVIGAGKMTESVTHTPTTGQKSGASTDSVRKILVDTDTVLKENFRGFGANCFPAIMSEEGMNKSGFNMVYNELNYKRLASIKPTVTRMWFQVDWIVTNTETDNSQANAQNNKDYINYKNGIYDFDSEMMQAVYQYIDMLDQAGSEVEINFGWKTATRIQHWFNTPCDNFKLGAPRELDLFGNAAAALVKELNLRGYDNVTAICFYNEPNLEGDFQSGVTGDGHDDSVYWSQLIREVDKAMKAQGVRDLIEIWGPEVSGIENSATREWFCYQLENTPYVDQWTGHHYYKTYDTNSYSNAFDIFKDYAELTDGNFMVTEMYGLVTNDIYKNWACWNDSTTSYLIAASNTGINGLLTWSMVGGYLPDPSNGVIECTESSPWAIPLSEETADRVNRVFYEQSLFTNYVPDGSKVLYTSWSGDDVRASSYLLPDGNITVLVENNGIFTDAVYHKGSGEEKDIQISVGDGKTRTFRRISYVPETQQIDSNATVNSPDRELKAKNGVFTDTLSEYYSVHIYTTAQPIKQVKIKDVTLHAKVGGAVNVFASLVDCEEKDEIVYSISKYTGEESGQVQSNGTYIASAKAKSGDMVAVRASLRSDPTVFAVAIIYID